jgi:CheY-like chemotaxis protein
MEKIKSILLVDDSKSDRLLFKMALEEIPNGKMYGEAQEGTEALAMLKSAEELPDLIFLDINMPGMDGLECLANIIIDPRTVNIPVVMLSSDIAHAETTRKLGARAFVQKPFDGELHVHIEKMINLDFAANNDIAQATFQSFSFR